MLRTMAGRFIRSLKAESRAIFRSLPRGFRVARGERSFSTSIDGSHQGGASRADLKKFQGEGGGEVTYEEAVEAAIRKYNKEAIPAHLMDIMLTDITEEGLKKAANSLGVENLARANYPARAFPVKGRVYGLNLRLMVNLVCGYEDRPPVNIVFLLDTGSAPSFITPSSIDALLGSRGGNIPIELDVCVQSPSLPVPMNTTPQGEHSHFPDANVLGMAALKELSLSIEIDYKLNAFHLVPNGVDGWKRPRTAYDIWRSEKAEQLTREAKAQGKFRNSYVGEQWKAVKDKSEWETKAAEERLKRESLEAGQRRIDESKTDAQMKAESLGKHDSKPGRL